jgi:hypothetical protein
MTLRTDLTDQIDQGLPANPGLHAGQHNEANTDLLALQAGRGDYATFLRGGSLDPTSGSFLYATDLVHTAGTTITVDSTSDWIANFGFPAPKVATAGAYHIHVAATGGTGGTDAAQVNLYDTTGSQFAPWTDTTVQGGFGATALGFMHYDLTVYLPADTHISVENVAPTDVETLFLVIQKVA